MLKRFRYQFLIGIIAVAVGISGCKPEQLASTLQAPSESVPASVLTVNVTEIKIENTFNKTIVYFGKLLPRRQSSLAFKKPGQLKQLVKKVGQSAEAGEVLADIDQASLEAQRNQLQQSYLSLEEQLTASGQTESQELADLRLRIDAIDLELAKGVITAPYNCIVASQNFQSGEATTPQRPVIGVIENAPATVEVELPARIADELESGQTVWVKVNEATFSSTLATKSPTVSATGNKRLTLEISNDSQNLSANMVGETVKVEFLMTSQGVGFWIPQSALVGSAGGLWSVMAVALEDSGPVENENGRANVVVQKVVEIVSVQNDRVFVKGSLVDGESVISNGTHRVVPGQRVIANDPLPIVSGGGDGQ